MTETLATSAIVKELTVPLPPERAFALFTREIGSWWPTDTHALHPGAVREVVWEEREGGELYEIATSGERARWAVVEAWEPPSRLVLSWHVNPERLGTEIEVTFDADGDGTRVVLEHRGFERLSSGGAEMRAGYDPGWDHVLGGFAARSGASAGA